MTTQITGVTQVTPPAFNEAPASATVEAYDPSGRRWLLTTRTSTTAELLTRLPVMSAWLDDHGWQTKPSKASPAVAHGDGDTCPEHGRPMKQGKYGLYCPVEVGKHPQTGKPIYCTHTVK